MIEPSGTGSPRRHDLSPLALLASYPHAAACPHCRDYLTGIGAVRLDPWDVVAAVLAFHDGGHRRDPLRTASEHFAVAALTIDGGMSCN
jgi:hypothetical protein